MEVKKLNVDARCDNGACVNKAGYIIDRDDTVTGNQLKFCESCLKELYFAIGKTLTPKSPKNVFERKEK